MELERSQMNSIFRRAFRGILYTLGGVVWCGFHAGAALLGNPVGPIVLVYGMGAHESLRCEWKAADIEAALSKKYPGCVVGRIQKTFVGGVDKSGAGPFIQIGGDLYPLDKQPLPSPKEGDFVALNRTGPYFFEVKALTILEYKSFEWLW